MWRQPPALSIIGDDTGQITMGTTLELVCRAANVKMDDIIIRALPFMVAQLRVLGLLVFFPRLVLVSLRPLSGG